MVTLSMLIADDAAEVVAFGARMEWAGCDVTIIAVGDLALAACHEPLPDIVLLDVELPPWDGSRSVGASARCRMPIFEAQRASLDGGKGAD